MNIPETLHRNLSDRIYDLLKEMIVRWEFRPGERLIDADLAERYGVSRSLVRNALTLLVSEGLVQVHRRRFHVARFTQKDIRDILQVRRMLEMSAFRAAARRVAAADLARLEERMAEAERLFAAGDLEPFYALDVETHRMIIDLGDNDYIKKVYSNISTILKMVIRSDFDKQRKISESFAEHTAVVGAWRRGDVAAAAAALDHHLERAEERVMENFAQKLTDLDTAAPESRPVANP